MNHSQDDKLAAFLRAHAPLAPAEDRFLEARIQKEIEQQQPRISGGGSLPALFAVAAVLGLGIFVSLSEKQQRLPKENPDVITASEALAEAALSVSGGELEEDTTLYEDWDQLASAVAAQ